MSSDHILPLPSADNPSPRPELFFGLAGPIGVDLNAVIVALEQQLKSVGYQNFSRIKLSDEMANYVPAIVEYSQAGFYNDSMKKIRQANFLRLTTKRKSVMAELGVRKIQESRETAEAEEGVKIPRTRALASYIFNQLKRPEEVEFLKEIYGRSFFLISVYSDYDFRKRALEIRIRADAPTTLSQPELAHNVEKLIQTDLSEDTNPYGQKLRNTFQMGDVFVDSSDPEKLTRTLTRFVRLLFGANDISPTKEEYGMYAAKSASLRSADLSRQVGAAIFSRDGEMITQGCNEVPKVGGGTYWEGEAPDYRDVKKSFDPNERLKKTIVRNIFEKLIAANFLSDKALSIGSASALTDFAISARSQTVTDSGGFLSDALVMDLTEYGRVVHAEMCAICDAARLGRSVKNATLFCTTFPCHNCTKHIIASGIDKVVYIEPYAKSRARDLHGDEVEIDEYNASKVSFIPFLGISPLRYRELFERGRRKDDDGHAQVWQSGGPKPIIGNVLDVYLDVELRLREQLDPVFEAMRRKASSPISSP